MVTSYKIRGEAAEISYCGLIARGQVVQTYFK